VTKGTQKCASAQRQFKVQIEKEDEEKPKEEKGYIRYTLHIGVACLKILAVLNRFFGSLQRLLEHL
jgi:hypothetical protein